MNDGQAYHDMPGVGWVGRDAAAPIAKTPSLSRDEAKAQFLTLTRRYGLRWTAATVPDKAAWEMMRRCNAVLDENDRRDALDLPTRR